jgi:transglutaminase-like putative cysteine protease
MLYAATHTTSHAFERPVSQCLTELRLTPRSLPSQRLRETVIDVDPAPNVLRRRKDYFGNEVTTVEVFAPHDRFQVKASSLVEVQAVKLQPLSTVSWEETRDMLACCPDAVSLKALEFVFDSPLVSAGEELADFARPTFSSGRPMVDALQEFSRRIHSEFRYVPKTVTKDLPLLEVLRNRQGACRDFAHVMIGSLRSLHLAARYVSGYLRVPTSERGVEAYHAWVSVFVPGSGWLDFDPTNGTIPADGHVTLAWGRDYGDVAPVKGIITGGGEQAIEVEITVRPIEDGETEPGRSWPDRGWRLSA